MKIKKTIEIDVTLFLTEKSSSAYAKNIVDVVEKYNDGRDLEIVDYKKTELGMVFFVSGIVGNILEKIEDETISKAISEGEYLKFLQKSQYEFEFSELTRELKSIW